MTIVEKEEEERDQLVLVVGRSRSVESAEGGNHPSVSFLSSCHSPSGLTSLGAERPHLENPLLPLQPLSYLAPIPRRKSNNTHKKLTLGRVLFLVALLLSQRAHHCSVCKMCILKFDHHVRSFLLLLSLPVSCF